MNFEDYVSDQFDIDLKNDELQLVNKMHKIKSPTYKLMSDLLQNKQTSKSKQSKKNLKKVRLPRKFKNIIGNQQFPNRSGSRVNFDSVTFLDTMKKGSLTKVNNNVVRFGTKKVSHRPRRPSIERTFQQQVNNTTLRTMKFIPKRQKSVLKTSKSAKSLKSHKSQKSQKSQKQVMLQNSNFLQSYTQKQFQDGTKFRGISQKGVLTKGQLTFKNKFVYNGELFLDKFHGKGKLFFPTGQVIEADWIQGQPIGKVTIKYPQGQLYYGDVKKYRRHGDGHLFFADGTKYQGAFVDGEVSGFGQFTSIDGEKTIGYWSIGQYIGANEEDYQRALNVTVSQKRKAKMSSTRRGKTQNQYITC